MSTLPNTAGLSASVYAGNSLAQMYLNNTSEQYGYLGADVYFNSPIEFNDGGQSILQMRSIPTPSGSYLIGYITVSGGSPDVWQLNWYNMTDHDNPETGVVNSIYVSTNITVTAGIID